MRNVHDPERAMYIYKQRKECKRKFADIGAELGISQERVRQVYRKTDWRLNGENSDAWRRDQKRRLRSIIESGEN